MYKWIHTSTEGWKHVKYINVGEVTDNSYLGWKKPRRKEQYVTINPVTGNIDWYYTFDGTWHKKDAEGNEIAWTPTEFSLTVNTNNDNYGDVSFTVAAPNTYNSTTGKVTKITTGDVAITLSASPESGYEVQKWQKNGTDIPDSTKANLEVTANADVTYTAVFKQSD